MIVEVFNPLRCSLSVLWDGRRSICSTGLNESYLAAICSAADTFVHTRRGRVEERARGRFVSKTNAPKAAVNSTTPAASSTFSKRALRSFF